MRRLRQTTVEFCSGDYVNADEEIVVLIRKKGTTITGSTPHKILSIFAPSKRAAIAVTIDSKIL